MTLAIATIAALALVLAPKDDVPIQEKETKISLDVKQADIRDVVFALSEAVGFQVVFDPGVNCQLTLKLREVNWQKALDLSLRSCGLEQDEDGGILRIAPIGRLAAEFEARRKLAEAREAARPLTVTRYRLSYARAAEMAPLLKKLLSPRGDITFDARTNTLYILD